MLQYMQQIIVLFVEQMRDLLGKKKLAVVVMVTSKAR